MAAAVAFACTVLGVTAAPSAGAAVCAAHFIGLHGVDEDTSSYTIVETIKATGSAVGPTGPPVEYEALDFPRLPAGEFLSQQFLGDPQVSPIVVGAGILRQRIADLQARDAAAGCPSKFLLAGFSEGAWVIDYYAHTSRGADLLTNGVIAAVVLYGDPQWDDGSRGQGLARRFGAGIDPYLPRTYPATVQSWCRDQDAICGGGMDPATVTPEWQLLRASECLYNPACSHFAYATGITGEAGRFLASRA